MKRTLAGLSLIVAVAAAGVWAGASMVPPIATPVREPALVVPAVGSPSATPSPSLSGSALPSVSAGSTTPAPSATQTSHEAEAPKTVDAPKPSYYDDDDRDDDDPDDDD